MEQTIKTTFIKADDNKILNRNCIIWVKKMDECLKICTKIDGCHINNTHTICKINNMDSYEELNKNFK